MAQSSNGRALGLWSQLLVDGDCKRQYGSDTDEKARGGSGYFRHAIVIGYIGHGNA